MPAQKRTECPVCGEVTYSRSGIHPQCAMKRRDEQRVARLKSKRKPAKKAAKQASALALKPWHKRCPKCRAQVHVRKSECDCGYSFTNRSRSDAE